MASPRALGPLLAAGSLLVAATVAWLVYGRLEPEPPTVQSVDTAARLQRVLEDRRCEGHNGEGPRGEGPRGAPDSNGYPPPFRWGPLDPQTAALFFPGGGRSDEWVNDPVCYIRRAASLPPRFVRFRAHPDGGWFLATNDYGMREDEDVRVERPDLRIVVTGDSHTDGSCNHSESFANLLEGHVAEELPGRSVECLNAGVGGFTFHNYVGMYERLRHLEPDVFVVVVYGGNDFHGGLLLQRYFEGLGAAREGPAAFNRMVRGFALVQQELSQAAYFANNPEDEDRAVDLACSFSVELERRCSQDGTELILVNLPPPTRAQPSVYANVLRRVLQDSGLEGLPVGVSDGIADRWLAFLGERGLRALDLRAVLGAYEEPLYWRSDYHLNVRGHEVVAEALHRAVRDALGPSGIRAGR